MKPTGVDPRKQVTSFSGSRSGNFALMTALIAPVGIVLAAIAVDGGSLYNQKREIQALADLAAITAAAHIDKAEIAVADTLRDNGVRNLVLKGRNGKSEIAKGKTDDAMEVTVIPGRYEARLGLAVSDRFVADAKPYDAVRVSLRTKGRQYFSAALMSAPRLSANAVASASADAAFSVGSRLLKLDGGLLNAILSGLTGSTVSLTVMDYEALANADIDLFRLSDALRSNLNLTAGTYSDVLRTQVTVSQIASAVATVSGANRNASIAAKALAGALGAGAKIRLDRLVDLGAAAGLPIGNPPSGLGATVSALDLLGASAALANGANQAKIDLGANVPGLLSAAVELAIGEPPQSSPWFRIGVAGDVVRTAQTRLRIVVEIGGPGGVLGASIKLPLYVEVAFAEATLTSIACTPGKRVTVSARPGVVEMRIAEAGALTDFRKDPSFAPARLVQVPLVSITGSADAAMTNLSSTALTFLESDVEKRLVKSVSTKDFTQSLTQSLLGRLQLDIKVAGLGLGLPGGLGQTVSGLLSAATPAVDKLLDGLLLTLGIRLGQADVRVTGLSCKRSVLVQ